MTNEPTSSANNPSLGRFTKMHWIHAVRSGVYLLLMFWLATVWIYSSAYDQTSRSGNIKIIVVDLDGESIGQSLVRACDDISGIDGMGSFHLLNISYEDAYNDVWEGHYWGAIIAMPNATHQLNLAIDDGSTLSNSSTAIAYIYNEVRWPTTVEGFVIPSLRQAVSDTNSGYLQNYGVEKLSNANLSANGIEVLLNGLQAKAVNIYAVTLGIKYYLNTAGMVFPALIMFLYSMALSTAPSLIGPLSTRNDFLYRMVVVPIMSCVSGISWGLWYEAFHESPNGISGGQYCVIWLTFWMYALIAFLLYDIMVGAIPAAFYPPMVLVYIIINVTAAAFPIDLKPRFFHLDYVWPGYNCFELLITILSHGSTSRVYRNVPVLFGWLVVLWPLDTWANKRRSMADLA